MARRPEEDGKHHAEAEEASNIYTSTHNTTTNGHSSTAGRHTEGTGSRPDGSCNAEQATPDD